MGGGDGDCDGARDADVDCLFSRKRHGEEEGVGHRDLHRLKIEFVSHFRSFNNHGLAPCSAIWR